MTTFAPLFRWLGATSAIAFTFILVLPPVLAQSIIPDQNVKPADRSRVIQDVIPGIDVITDGARRGSNLFHSFSQFNVLEGRGAYFDDPAGVNNIFSRVTGGSRSEIMGTLGVLGSANLFFINPNGILFGPNASLSVQGAFVATTANAITFENGQIFDTTNPEVSQLLAVNPRAFLFNQIAAQPQNSIENQGSLRVPTGQNLVLLGGTVAPTPTATGNVLINGGSLFAPSGRIEVGSVGGSGRVMLNPDFSLDFPPTLERTDVLLANGAVLNVRNNTAGDITVNARTIELSGASRIRAGLDSGLGFEGSQAGDIALDATDNIQLREGSGVADIVDTSAVGNAGNIRINTGSLNLDDNSVFNTSAFPSSQGRAGNIFITARGDVSIDHAFINAINNSGKGDAGSITIRSNAFALTGGSVINTSNALSEGNAGNISITANSNVVLSQGSGLEAAIGSSKGNGGSISISGSSISLLENASLYTLVANLPNSGANNIPSAQGNAGAISLTAQTVNVDNSRISSVSEGGDGGNVSIQAEAGSVHLTADPVNSFLDVRNGNIGTSSARNTSGAVSITTGSLTLQNFSIVTGVIDSSGTTESGTAGNLSVMATNSLDLLNSQLYTGSLGGGQGGNITIMSPHIDLREGSIIDPANFGSGAGGAITITTNQLQIQSGSDIGVSSNQEANSGDITIAARDFVEVAGSTILRLPDVIPPGFNFPVDPSLPPNSLLSLSRLSTSADSGVAGKLRIDTGRLIIRGGGQVTTRSIGSGTGGRLMVNASDSVEVSGTTPAVGGTGMQFLPSALGTDNFGGGKSGDVEIRTNQLTVRDGGQVSTATRETGQGGQMTINATNFIEVSGTAPEEPSSGIGSSSAITTETSGTGEAGGLTINTSHLSIQNGARLSASTSSTGQGGAVLIHASEAIEVSGSAHSNQTIRSTLSSATSGAGNAGSLQLFTDHLTVGNGALLSAATSGSGAGNNISIAANTVTLSGTTTNHQFRSTISTASE
jgi:filamentous hemagglutinin family protein